MSIVPEGVSGEREREREREGCSKSHSQCYKTKCGASVERVDQLAARMRLCN
jgi:hypothetical protein